MVRALGRGAPDSLFEVVDEANRKFAMRAPIGDLRDGDAVTRHFLPLAAELRGLMHLHLVPLFDVFVDKGLLCLVVELVRGRGLQAAIDGELGPRTALLIGRQVLEGLTAVHAAGRVHRDLQPLKVLLAPMSGWELAKVADAGIGTLIDEALLEFGDGALTGTIPKPYAAYMAPEQVRGRSVDARTDVYAMGIMLYQMLARRLPFWDSDPQLVMQLQTSMPAPRLDEVCRGEPWCTPEVLSMIEKALEKDRDARYADAAEMLKAVDDAILSIQHLPAE
ncbi:MAG: serine/threonine protein kinase [Deltaproteobacteria bacterium]|nr:serine/threonine protein kinase [Deltaproteobacteria bacterium]